MPAAQERARVDRIAPAVDVKTGRGSGRASERASLPKCLSFLRSRVGAENALLGTVLAVATTAADYTAIRPTESSIKCLPALAPSPSSQWMAAEGFMRKYLLIKSYLELVIPCLFLSIIFLFMRLSFVRHINIPHSKILLAL